MINKNFFPKTLLLLKIIVGIDLEEIVVGYI